GCGTDATKSVTVLAAPNGISGASYVCTGSSALLSDGSAGGVWTSGTSVLATVDASGNVYGVNAGIASITYSTGCGADVFYLITVKQAPSPISGLLSVCSGI